MSYVAVEAEMLLQHTCEALLRLWFAHRPDAQGAPPSCPWLELSGDRDFSRFRARCKELASSSENLALPCLKVFVNTGTFGAEDLDSGRKLGEFLKLAAQVCGDPSAYNAAKHGLAAHGGRSRFEVEVDGVCVFDVEGYDLETLEVADRDGRRRWAITTKWIDLERSLTIAWLITNLMQSMWSVARYRYVTRAGTVRTFQPGDTDTLLNYGEIVLAQRRDYLAYVDDKHS
jgi:hypothetical protein